MALRTVPIRKSANRPNLFMGGDREMVMFSGLLAFTLIFGMTDIKAAVYGVILWSMALYLLRQMAKSDPQLRQVYLRHRLYRKYYAARSTPFYVNTTTQEKQYRS